MNIKEIALKRAREYLTFKLGGRKGCDVEEIVGDDEIYAEIVNELAGQFEALVAEIQRQSEPVGCADKASFEWHIKNSPGTSFGIWTTSDWKRKLNLPDQKPILFFTFPPSIEALEDKVAEACAAYLSNRAKPNLEAAQVMDDSVAAIRSGEWKKFKGE